MVLSRLAHLSSGQERLELLSIFSRSPSIAFLREADYHIAWLRLAFTIYSASFRDDRFITSDRRSFYAMRIDDCSFLSDAISLRIPFETELPRRRHVPGERRGRDNGGAREKAFAADTHTILPVAIE